MTCSLRLLLYRCKSTELAAGDDRPQSESKQRDRRKQPKVRIQLQLRRVSMERALTLFLLFYFNFMQVVVKIADFGLSGFFRPGTDFKTNCGSLSYIAPEVYLGTAHEGPPLDVWSLGVILFAILCGRLPFTSEKLGEDDRTSSRQIRKRVVDVTYSFDDDVKPTHQELIKSMLRLQPDARATVPLLVQAVGTAKRNSFAQTAAMLKNWSPPASASTETRKPEAVSTVKHKSLARSHSSGDTPKRSKDAELQQTYRLLRGENEKARRKKHQQRHPHLAQDRKSHTQSPPAARTFTQSNDHTSVPSISGKSVSPKKKWQPVANHSGQSGRRVGEIPPRHRATSHSPERRPRAGTVGSNLKTKGTSGRNRTRHAQLDTGLEKTKGTPELQSRGQSRTGKHRSRPSSGSRSRQGVDQLPKVT